MSSPPLIAPPESAIESGGPLPFTEPVRASTSPSATRRAPTAPVTATALSRITGGSASTSWPAARTLPTSVAASRVRRAPRGVGGSSVVRRGCAGRASLAARNARKTTDASEAKTARRDAPPALADRSGDRAARRERGETCWATAGRERAVPPSLELERARSRTQGRLAGDEPVAGRERSPRLHRGDRYLHEDAAELACAADDGRGGASAPSPLLPARWRSPRAKPEPGARPRSGAAHRGRSGRTHVAREDSASRTVSSSRERPPRASTARTAPASSAASRASAWSYSDRSTLRESATATTAASNPRRGER